MDPRARNRSLDVLRAVAVVAVLVFHFVESPFAEHGWMGVDLFFVLSGFLVAGLLFDELSRRGTVRPFRFLARRGFKIYPAFWLMVAVSVVFGPPARMLTVACELLFFQNYGPGLWVHTWSLAVEEHFYLLVAAAFAWRGIFSRLDTPRRQVGAFVGGLVAVLASRIVTFVVIPARYKLVFFGTHVRLDALLFGTLLAWLVRHPAYGPRMKAYVAVRRAPLAALALLALVPAVVLGRQHWFVITFGLTMVYLGCGCLLLVALSVQLTGPVSRALAWLGRSSYSIYLWHLPVHVLLVPALAAHGLVPASWGKEPAVALVAALAIGVLGTRLIEDPVLGLRDRVVP